jgi:transcription elongation factor GreA
MTDTTRMTSEARDRLVAEIARLEGEERREVAARMKVAREWGDLKENAEYHAAKADAAMLELKIERRRSQLRSAEIVEAAAGVEGAGLGSTVTYTDEASGRELTHTLVSQAEARPADGLISIESPVGKTLAGARPGDRLYLTKPIGTGVVTTALKQSAAAAEHVAEAVAWSPRSAVTVSRPEPHLTMSRVLSRARIVSAPAPLMISSPPEPPLILSLPPSP